MLRWLPEDVSTFGQEIDSLFYLIYYITGVTFILVTVLMIWFLIQYRHREGRRATYTPATQRSRSSGLLFPRQSSSRFLS